MYIPVHLFLTKTPSLPSANGPQNAPKLTFSKPLILFPLILIGY